MPATTLCATSVVTLWAQPHVVVRMTLIDSQWVNSQNDQWAAGGCRDRPCLGLGHSVWNVASHKHAELSL